MWYRYVITTIIFIVFTGCSVKKPESYYEWKTTNTIIHDKIISMKSVKIREIKYVSVSKKNWKDGTNSFTDKEDRYLYIEPHEDLVIKEGSLKEISKNYKRVILFKGSGECKDKNYPCSFSSLRLQGVVYKDGIKNNELSRRLSLSTPIRIETEEEMRVKVYSFIKQKGQ